MECIRRVVTNAPRVSSSVRYPQACSGGLGIETGELATFCGDYQLDCVTHEWWYITHPKGQPKNNLNQRSWAGCNDRDWVDIMNQLGEARNPYFVR